MLTAPPDLTAEQVSSYLRAHWGIVAAHVSYAAVGHGSHNWTVTAADGSKWFVKADRMSNRAERFRATYQTVAAIRDSGLDFVHAAIRDRSGELWTQVSPSWALGVFPFINGRNPDFCSAERTQIARIVGQLHAFTPIPDTAPRWAPDIRHVELRHLLANELDHPWTEGPYGEPARALFTSSAAGIEGLLTLYGQLVDRVLAGSDDPWVITHGEPHGGNTMIDTEGRLHLIDCDDMMIAPRERDLWLLLHGGHQHPLDLDNTDVVEAYQVTAGPVEVLPSVIEMFRAEWHLNEISSKGQEFGSSHAATDDVAGRWESLNRYLPVTQNWPNIIT